MSNRGLTAISAGGGIVIAMMSHSTRIKIAALTTALALGGLTAAGIALRSDGAGPSAASATATQSKKQEPVVIHRRTVKTVVAKPRAGNATGASSSAATGAAVQTGPATVASPRSPVAPRPDDEDDDGHEREEEEHD